MESSDDEQGAEPEPTPEQVDRLVAELKSPDSKVRMSAAEALRDRGSSAAAVAPALIEALKDEEREVGFNAADTPGRIAAGLTEEHGAGNGHELVNMLSVWQDAQSSMAAMDSKAAPSHLNVEAAQASVRRLAAALRAAQAGNS